MCDVLDREVRIRARKQTEDWWPRLLYNPAKLPWLKLDFDRVRQQEPGATAAAQGEMDANIDGGVDDGLGLLPKLGDHLPGAGRRAAWAGRRNLGVTKKTNLYFSRC